jgi:hypothetical protein
MQVVYRAISTSGPLRVGLAQNALPEKRRGSRQQVKTPAFHAQQAIFQRLAVLACLAAEESSRITDPMCAFCAQIIISAQKVLVQSLVLPGRKPPFVAQTIRGSARRVP